MSLNFEERTVASQLVKSMWRSQSEKPGVYISVAADHWSFLFGKKNGKLYVDVCGPETRATPGVIPAETDVFGINFRPGVYLPQLSPHGLVDTRVVLANASDRAFWLGNMAWPFPAFDDLEVFAERLVRRGLLVQDPVVSAVLGGEPPGLSPRALQYRFMHTTGLTRKTIEQIQRARQAALWLEQGVPIADTVYRLGYADQAHLTRSLRHLYGQTPTTVAQVTATLAPS